MVFHALLHRPLRDGRPAVAVGVAHDAVHHAVVHQLVVLDARGAQVEVDVALVTHAVDVLGVAHPCQGVDELVVAWHHRVAKAERWQGAPSVPEELPSTDPAIVRLQALPRPLLVFHVHHYAAPHPLGVHLSHRDVVEVAAVYVQLTLVADGGNKANNGHGGAHKGCQLPMQVVCGDPLVQVGGYAKVLQPCVFNPLWAMGEGFPDELVKAVAGEDAEERQREVRQEVPDAPQAAGILSHLVEHQVPGEALCVEGRHEGPLAGAAHHVHLQASVVQCSQHSKVGKATAPAT
mmetsp:Transcript_35824/g.101383  ORF Transcript_35824/g.101383 Transcript_35824/m.101383 type:complete len:291 (-) Transcript_35824:2287-3159(-)